MLINLQLVLSDAIWSSKLGSQLGAVDGRMVNFDADYYYGASNNVKLKNFWLPSTDT